MAFPLDTEAPRNESLAVSLRILSLEHVAHEGPGRIASWAALRGHDLRSVSAAGDTLPPADSVEMLVIMGGPMNIYQHRDHPWLAEEKRFIAEATACGIPVLGICLGAQLLADVLGGKVLQNPVHELGWMPVRFLNRTGAFAAFPDSLCVMHWHGDTFTLPTGAVLAATNEACDHQAFIWQDRVVGLQFHPELDPAAVRALALAGHVYAWDGPFVQSVTELLQAQVAYEPLEKALHSLLDHLAGLALSRARQACA